MFDLDGVLTQTATLHAQAWKEMFDAFLREWSQHTGGEALRAAGIEDLFEARIDGDVADREHLKGSDALRAHGADVVVEDLAELLERR